MRQPRRIVVSTALLVLASAGMLPAPAASEPELLLPLVEQAGERMGGSVAIQGDTALLGSTQGTFANGTRTGAVWVFGRNESGEWIEQQQLFPNNVIDRTEYGYRVALDGDHAIVGAPRDNSSETWGAAYLYERNGDGSWTAQLRVTPTDYPYNGAFGKVVALHGDTAMVGASQEDGQTGAVYVYTRTSEGGWSSTQKIPGRVSQGPCPFDPCFGPGAGFFGRSIAIQDDTALIGASAEDPSGVAYVFTRGTDGLWTQQQRLEPNDLDYNAVFGSAVALDGDTAVVGAYQDDELDGSAYVFTRDAAGAWTAVQKLIPADRADDDRVGYSVALDGDTAVVGALTAGSACVFTRNAEGLWTEQEELAPSANGLSDRIGVAVGLDGSTVALGAPGYDGAEENSGAAWVIALADTVTLSAESACRPFRSFSRTLLLVTIHGSATLDVSEIDVRTLRLGNAEASPRFPAHLDDVDRDGFRDLLVRFEVSGDERSRSKSLDLSGTTRLGRRIAGSTLLESSCDRSGFPLRPPRHERFEALRRRVR